VTGQGKVKAIPVIGPSAGGCGWSQQFFLRRDFSLLRLKCLFSKSVIHFGVDDKEPFGSDSCLMLVPPLTSTVGYALLPVGASEAWFSSF
jgi:hypothetical protein